MAPQSKNPRFERIVLEWERPIYSLALRMLGDPGEAQDATQDVFVRLLRDLDRYDPRMPFKPWLYRVATRLILNRKRSRATRSRIERDAAGERVERTMDRRVEERERQEAVGTTLQRLEPEDRAILVLHFYEGLTKKEVAGALSIPRTTAHARLDRALRRFRSELQVAGHAALAPIVCDLMRGAPRPTVPQTLAESLARLAETAPSALSAAGATALGGALMAKHTAVLVTLLTLGALGIGVFAGRSGARDAATGRTAAADRTGRVQEAPDATIEELRARAERAERERDELRAQLEAPQETGPQMAAPEAGASRSEIEWEKLGRLLAKSQDVIARTNRDDFNELSDAEKVVLVELLAELTRVAAAARGVNPHPFFDERILPDLMEAIYGEALGLDEATRASVRAITREVGARETRGFDPAKALPIERLALRGKILDELRDRLVTAVPADKRESFVESEGTARDVVFGSRTIVTVRLERDDGLAGVAGQILDAWKSALPLTDAQHALARELAEQFARQADDRARRHGLGTEGADERAYDAAITELQIAFERRLAEGFDEEQKERLDQALPTRLRFRRDEGDTMVTTNSGGF